MLNPGTCHVPPPLAIVLYIQFPVIQGFCKHAGQEKACYNIRIRFTETGAGGIYYHYFRLPGY
jgi:hypothetical protein